MPSRLSLAVIGVLLLVAGSPKAQDHDLDVVLDRMATYLEAYERELSTLIADEHYVQEEHRVPAQRPNAARIYRDPARVDRRTTDAEVLFLRLPGEPTWFGVRDVKKVDGRAVPGTGETLTDLARQQGADLVKRAAAIVEASSQYNLGGRRTINMPTVPLEVLSSRHQARYIFKIAGQARVAGALTVKLEFHEFAEPTLVASTDGGSLWTRGTAWVAPTTGAIWRVELVVGPDGPDTFRRVHLESRLRVEFAHDPSTGVLVPKELVETWIAGGSGSGRARYDNYRRFTTAARVVPVPMR